MLWEYLKWLFNSDWRMKEYFLEEAVSTYIKEWVRTNRSVGISSRGSSRSKDRSKRSRRFQFHMGSALMGEKGFLGT